jgi:glycolate oxidase subunit GlcD
MVDESIRQIDRLARSLPGIPVHTDPHYRLAYTYDATGLRGECGGVAFPGSLDDLRNLVREAAARGIPLFPRGAGSGFSGGSIPLRGGLVVSGEKLDRIRYFDRDRETVSVECGVVNRALQDFLEPLGYFYPPDPASLKFSTIGGNIAENAGGPKAFKYGVTRRYVRSITWVESGGDLVETAPEGVTSLIVGAEGTLGLIYSATLSVLPLPEAFQTAFLAIDGDERAVTEAVSFISSGFCPSVLEYIDLKTMRCVAEYRDLGMLDATRSYLFVEVDGSPEGVFEEFRLLEDLCRNRDIRLITARDASQRELLWEVRRSISPSLARRGVTKVNEDVSLPLGRLAETVAFVHRLAGELALDCYIFGHCGDGNLHINIMTDRRDRDEMVRVERFVRTLFERVTASGGTLSGEHGIGLTKSEFLDMIFSPSELMLQRRIKEALDPRNILNPGKYFTVGQ